MAKLFANTGDPDQMPHSAASDLGLHCLPIIPLYWSPDYNGLIVEIKQWYCVGNSIQTFYFIMDEKSWSQYPHFSFEKHV